MKLYQRILMGLGASLPSKIRLPLFRLAGMKIGANTRITSGFYIDRPEGAELGHHCFLNHFVHFHNGANKEARIVFGDNVFVGPDVKLMCTTHEMGTEHMRAGKDIFGSIVVEDGVWIGAGATILPGVKIARGGVIGAGAVVSKSTEPNGLYLGVPAKRIKDLP